MEITGYYTKDEAAPDGFQNMGEARADAARIALGLDKNRTMLKGIVSSKEVDKDNRFQGVSFKTISAKPALVEETDDGKVNIRFPYNSTDKLSDASVENYLNKVASRVKKSGEKIRLIGHTDSDGDANYNMSLGKKRADIIKAYLVSKGVSSSKITTLSKGETQPEVPNTTNRGKAQNRRTELEILK
jgi:outer membrane protein OmpA-like peptidoglycan-associated protein